MGKITEKELIKKIKESKRKKELYRKCLDEDICPECGNKLIRINNELGGCFFPWGRETGHRCTVCKFDNVQQYDYASLR